MANVNRRKSTNKGDKSRRDTSKQLEAMVAAAEPSAAAPETLAVEKHANQKALLAQKKRGSGMSFESAATGSKHAEEEKKQQAARSNHYEAMGLTDTNILKKIAGVLSFPLSKKSKKEQGGSPKKDAKGAKGAGKAAAKAAAVKNTK